MFSSRSPSRSLNKSAGNQLQNGANKKAKKTELEPGCIDYQPGKTRMAAIHEVTLSAVHETTLLAVRIEFTRFALSVMYTDPTRLLSLSE